MLYVILAACSLHNIVKKIYIPPHAVIREDFVSGNFIHGYLTEHT